MKKHLIVITAFLLLTALLFSGCAEEKSDFSYDKLLEMKKDYVAEVCNVYLGSYQDYKTLIENVHSKDVTACFECLETTFYTTIRNADDGFYMTGKTVNKCKITAIYESFNGCSVTVGTVVDVVQSYYIDPIDDDDTNECLERYGAVHTRDSSGKVIKTEIADGDYVLEYRDDVEYRVVFREYELPMEVGKSYTGVLRQEEDAVYVDFLAVQDNTQRYDEFRGYEDVEEIAAEIKALFTD